MKLWVQIITKAFVSVVTMQPDNTTYARICHMSQKCLKLWKRKDNVKGELDRLNSLIYEAMTTVLHWSLILYPSHSKFDCGTQCSYKTERLLKIHLLKNVFESLVPFEFKDCRKLKTELGIFENRRLIWIQKTTSSICLFCCFFTVETTYLNKFSSFSSYHL